MSHYSATPVDAQETGVNDIETIPKGRCATDHPQNLLLARFPAQK